MLRSFKMIVVCFTLVALLGMADGARAQLEDDAWGEPVNLSRSGAASQPRIVGMPDGTLQAFWWDRFDGMMTARFDGETWSGLVRAPILTTELVREEIVISEAVETTPYIAADLTGWVYAFWLDKIDQYAETSSLFYSRMPVGGTTWSDPDVLAESAAAFDVAAAPDGGLALAYARPLHTDAFPAGIYVKRNAGGGGGWGPPAIVDGSIYYRLMADGGVYLRVADGGDGTVHVAWQDLHLGQALYARSTDGGITWPQPEVLGGPDDRPARPRAFALADGGTLRLWQATGLGGCALQQQRLVATEAVTPTWGTSQQVLEGVTTCPQDDRAWLQDDGLLWLWGEGSGALTLAAWDGGGERWSEPRSFGFRFQEPEMERWIQLNDLHVALAGDVLAVAGSDLTTGEVWVVKGQVSALELAFAPPSPWSVPVRLTELGEEVDWPAVAVDEEGGVHVVWGQATTVGGPDTALFYARWDGGRWSRAVSVVSGAPGEEMARQPALLADAQGLLHLVWSGGGQGQIFYRRAKIGEAVASGGWSRSQRLSAPNLTGAAPQIGTDAAGRLYVAYAVPLNEGRGIYLTRSRDGGNTWAEPEVVFDAEGAGWTMADRPALAVDPDGALHVAWIWGALPQTWSSQGIYYARSAGDGEWTEAYEVAEAGYDWPRLVLVGEQAHLLYAEVGRGQIWHRVSAIPDEDGGESAWGTPLQISGLSEVGVPVGIAVDGEGTLHLVAVASDGGRLLYTTQEGGVAPASGRVRWGQIETVALGAEIDKGLGVAAAVLPQGERLAVVPRVMVIQGEEQAVPAILATWRSVSDVDVLLASPVATAAPEMPPGPTLEPTVVPTPTPDLSNLPEPGGSADLPLFLGGGLAAVIVIGVLATWGLRRLGR